MAKEVRLPKLGQTMEEATIIDCMVKVGDEVKKGEVIFEIETDKATLDVESPCDGFVKYILADTDQTLPVGEPLLVFGEKDEDVPQSFVDSLKSIATAKASPAAAIPPAEPAKTQPQPEKKTDKVVAPPRPSERRGSPRAKRLARELGVGLATITGTGPGGKITEQDVKKAAACKLSVPTVSLEEAELGQIIPLTKKQKLTAERMLKSKREIPCFYLTVKADVTDLVELRTKMNQTNEVKISYNDFIIRAVAIGLEKFPVMTGQLAGDAIELAEVINIGLAISVPDGLIVPVVKNANKKDATAIARETGALIEKANSNKLLLTDLEGGCITISNLGAFGAESFIPIVMPGQCSILGIGQITDTCVPNNGDIIVRKLMSMTLSVDHRIANGAYAARFLDFVKKLLEDTSTFT
ncbi:Dihydrolipoyllysine-residue acetyltransferase component of pyruvate dehydrogenase complex [subsurface metagenome]